MNKERTGLASRRGVLRAGLAVVAAGGAATAAVAAEMNSPAQRIAQTDKLAQNIVQYQTSPKDGAMCSTCVNFEPPNACKIVDGNIVPNGWCVAYAPKNG